MNKFLKVVIGLAVVVGLAAVILSNGRQADPFVEGTESASRLQPGPHHVNQHDEEFIDPSRGTDANGDFPGEPVRRLAEDRNEED